MDCSNRPCEEASCSWAEVRKVDESNYFSEVCQYTDRKTNLVLQSQKSTVTFTDVGGQDDVLLEILKLFLHLKHDLGLGHRPPGSILIHGPSGSGKTHLVRAVAGELALPYIEVVATELVSGVSGESESKIRDMFEEALKCTPCILFIDELDAICPKRETTDKSMARRMVSQLCRCLNDLYAKDNSSKVKVFAATSRLNIINSILRRHFERQFEIKIPNEDSRLKILKMLCKNLKFSPDFDMNWLAKHTPGYVGADLKTLITEACVVGDWRIFEEFVNASCAKTEKDAPDEKLCSPSEILSSLRFKDSEIPGPKKENVYYKLQDFKVALRKCKSYANRAGFETVPDVTWNDVFVCQSVKEKLQQLYFWPIKFRKQYEASGMPSSKGIILFGPKGCGKSLLAKALANQGCINFLQVKGYEPLSMYLGESEKNIEKIFQEAKVLAPCLIFFDEFDMLCPSREGLNVNPASQCLVSQLLTLIDGIENYKGVFIVAATSRPDAIDSGMLRPGRLEKAIYVDVPSPTQRVEILKSITKNKTRLRVSKEVNFEEIAFDSRCDNFSGADLSSLVEQAFQAAVEEFDSSESKDKCIILHKCHFQLAFSVVKPSITEKDKTYFQGCLKQMNCANSLK